MYLLKPYDDALQEILEQGVARTNKRTGIKTLSIFGMLKRYRLDSGYFPILTRRKVWPKAVFSELLWFLSGSTNNEDLKKVGCNFWTPWVDPEFEKKHGYAAGSFGPVYGFQLRHFGGEYGNGIGGTKGSPDPFIKRVEWAPPPAEGGTETQVNIYGQCGFDQLNWLVNRIKEDSSCRRTLFTLWNPQQIGGMRLPPCHMLYQVLVDDERRMNGILYQRSGDYPVGCCANAQFYSALTTMIAQQTECEAHEFVHVVGDAHIYMDQVDAVKQYLQSPIINSPKLEIKKAKDIFSYTIDDFVLTEYNPGPKIEIPVAV